jgi:hypothetical protein
MGANGSPTGSLVPQKKEALGERATGVSPAEKPGLGFGNGPRLYEGVKSRDFIHDGTSISRSKKVTLDAEPGGGCWRQLPSLLCAHWSP